MTESGSILLEMSGIQKSFPGVQAVRDGRLELRGGEIHALVGENGAGKSTLLKVLAGAHQPEAGSIRLEGKIARIHSPHHARKLGIAVIYQEFNLVPTLSVRENLFLGRERAWGGFVRAADERQAAHELFARLGFSIHPEALCRSLPVAQQQIVEIAKALAENARILVMDEPTAALSHREVEKLFGIARDLRARGIGILYVSHRLDEIFALCDRVTVMRDGCHVATHSIGDLDRERLIELMVGRKVAAHVPSARNRRREEARGTGELVPRLQVQGLCRGQAVQNVSFAIRAGEVLGLTGLVGAGRTEVARLLFGADRADAGTIMLDGQAVTIRCPRDAIRQGLCLLTEDRKQQGLVLGLSVRDNFSLPNLRDFSRGGFLRRRGETEACAGFVRQLRMKVPHLEQLARNLSGGTQQKLVLAKWLQANTKVILFDEPTRGVDVGAKYEIYQLIQELAAAGKAILVISSELPEVLGICDRILVMREGRLGGEITNVAAATQEQIMALAIRSS